MENRTVEMSRRYKAGESLRDIADSFRISYERVRQILEREGVERRPRGFAGGRPVDPAREKLLGAIKELVEKKGLSFRQTASKLKLSYQQVTYACGKLGVKSKYRTRYPQFAARVKRLKALMKSGYTLNGSIVKMRRAGDKITQKWVADNKRRIWP